MYAVISPEKIEIPAGSIFQMPGTWSEYETLSKQLGDRSIPRLKYRPGKIWFMSPLPEHGRNASLVADTIKAILDHYVESDRSRYFPDVKVLQLVLECFTDAKNRNTSSAIRQLRQKLNES